MAFDYCTLPADDERSIRPFELAPVGSRRFIRSPGDLTHRGIIALSRGCVVSAPLPGLSPCCSGSPLSHGEGTFLSWRVPSTRLPSAIRLLLADYVREHVVQKDFSLRRGQPGSDHLGRGESRFHRDLAASGIKISRASTLSGSIFGHYADGVLSERLTGLCAVVASYVRD